MDNELNNLSAPARLKALQERAAYKEWTALDYSMVSTLLRDDPCPIVRHEAAFVLAGSDGYGFLEEGQRALIMALEDPSILVRHEAALSLGKFPSEMVIEALVKLASSDASPDVIASIRYALSDMHTKPD